MLAACATLVGCGGGHGVSPPTLADLISGAAAVARVDHPGARLLDAQGRADRGHVASDLKRWQFLFTLTDGPADDGKRIVITWAAGAYSSPALVDLPAEPDQSPLADRPPMALDEALRRLRTAGCDGEYNAVRYWQPVGASRPEPVFEFEIPRLGGVIAVGAVSGMVSGLPAGGAADGAVFSAVFQGAVALFPRARFIRATATFADGSAAAVVSRWDLRFENPADTPASAVVASWSSEGGYSQPATGALGNEGLAPVGGDMPDPATRWVELLGDPELAANVSSNPVAARGTLHFPESDPIIGYTGTQPYYLYELASPPGVLRVGGWSGTMRFFRRGGKRV